MIIGVECKKCGNREIYGGIVIADDFQKTAEMLADNFVFQKCSNCEDEYRVQSYNLIEMK